MSHRTSYLKTTAFFSVGAGACVLAFFIVRLSSLAPLSILVVSFVLAIAVAISLLLAAGGLLCVWRDSREAAGQPDLLADLAIRKPARPFARHLMRFLGGPNLYPGDVVRVKSLQVIEATLDKARTLDNLPFLQEMEPFCGRVFRVHRRVDHVNDMRNKTGLRRIRGVVTLTGVRCSGQAHDGCEAECQILWKDVWLERLPRHELRDDRITNSPFLGSLVHGVGDADGKRYFCQMTQLWEASERMSIADIRQDLRPLLSGNIGVRAYLVWLLTQLFNTVQNLRGGFDYPHMPKPSKNGRTVASEELNLNPGDAVTVRSKAEIAATLTRGKNRGLWFDRDMVRFCGRTATVRKRVTRIIHEGSGKMVVLKTLCVILDNVIATGEFLRLCPQHEYIFWREAWLQRAEPQNQKTATGMKD